MVLNRVISSTLKDLRNVCPLIPLHYVLDEEDPLLLFGPAVFLNHGV